MVIGFFFILGKYLVKTPLEFNRKFSSSSKTKFFPSHAGSTVAELSSKQLVDHIVKQEYFNTLRSEPNLVANNEYDSAKICAGIKAGFLSLDAQLKEEERPSGCTGLGWFFLKKIM